MAGRGRDNANERLAVALASGRTLRDAAKEAGISERTAYRRIGAPDFQSRVVELRGEMTDHAVGRLAESLSQAVATLQSLLASPDERNQLRAAVAILNHGLPKATHNDEAEAVRGLATPAYVLFNLLDKIKDKAARETMKAAYDEAVQDGRF